MIALLANTVPSCGCGHICGGSVAGSSLMHSVYHCWRHRCCCCRRRRRRRRDCCCCYSARPTLRSQIPREREAAHKRFRRQTIRAIAMCSDILPDIVLAASHFCGFRFLAEAKVSWGSVDSVPLYTIPDRETSSPPNGAQSNCGRVITRRAVRVSTWRLSQMSDLLFSPCFPPLHRPSRKRSICGRDHINRFQT